MYKVLWTGGNQKLIERYKKLHSEGNIKSDILYYNKMMGMTYDEAKSKFFNEVGR
jgi:1-aminocyclopropane-1-carboxylate deaminase/D-cysteine desulfhydrase-like pyridoxal-dependent ACC family enzyme